MSFFFNRNNVFNQNGFSGNATFTNVLITGDLVVDGNTTLHDTTILGSESISKDLVVGGNEVVQQGLQVNGNTLCAGGLQTNVLSSVSSQTIQLNTFFSTGLRQYRLLQQNAFIFNTSPPSLFKPTSITGQIGNYNPSTGLWTPDIAGLYYISCNCNNFKYTTPPSNVNFSADIGILKNGVLADMGSLITINPNISVPTQVWGFNTAGCYPLTLVDNISFRAGLFFAPGSTGSAIGDIKCSIFYIG